VVVLYRCTILVPYPTHPGLPGCGRAAAAPQPDSAIAQRRIPEDYEEVETPASVGMDRARTQEADRAGGAVDIYQGVARGARYPLH
jgi:hypothetical protein